MLKRLKRLVLIVLLTALVNVFFWMTLFMIFEGEEDPRYMFYETTWLGRPAYGIRLQRSESGKNDMYRFYQKLEKPSRPGFPITEAIPLEEAEKLH